MKKKCDFLPPRRQRWKFNFSLRMRLLVTLLLVGALHVSANSVAQTKVSLTMKNAAVEEVFQRLESMTGYTFLYNLDLLKGCGRVDVDARDEDFSQLLAGVLKPLGLAFTIDDRVVVITRDDEKKAPKELIIKGRVLMKDSTSLPGATVIVKGTSVGVVTDNNGRFTLSVLNVENPVLVFSFVGLKKKEVKYEGKEMLVVMEKEIKEVEEVVVTGYQTLDRRDVVGAYTTVNADDIIMPSYSSIDQMLQGQIAGLMVINTSSRVGTSPKIKLRGTSTLLGNQAPLWVVDGIVQEDPLELNASLLMTEDLADIIGSQVSWLNPMDIETITVLKDASATAIYGSKASNGVIVITTKKGQIGRLTVNYTGNVTINTRPNYGMFNYMNSKERIEFSQDVFNGGAYYQYEPIAQPYTYEGALKMYLQGDLSSLEFAERTVFLETVNTDWFDLLTRSAVSHNHNLSVSGGTESVTYNVSVGYNNTLGQEIGNETEKMTARLNTNIRLHEKVRLDATINVSTTTTSTFNGVNPMSYATQTSRAIPAYDENGEPVYYQKRTSYLYNSSVNSLSYNLINERDNTGAENENSYFSASLNFRWNILNWLSYEFTGGYTVNSTNAESWATERSYDVAQRYRGYDYGTVEPGSAEFKAAQLPFGGYLYTSNATQKSYNIQNKILFSKSFNNNHRLNAMIAMEVRSSKTENNVNTVWGYMPDRGESLTKPTIPSEFDPIDNAFTGWGILDGIYNGLNWDRTNKTDNYFSYFATVAYSLKNRYVFNASMRNDESNRFGQDVNHRFDPTYSFGLSWAVMEEPWMQDVSRWINSFNIRATYGIQGNAMTRIGPDLILTQMGIEDVYNDYSSIINRLPNPNLSWERTKSWDFGVDMRLFNMFDLVMDYYTRSSNVIVEQDLAYEYGMYSMEMNGGKITNEGIEFTLSFTPVQTKNWALNLSLNSSKNWNETGKPEYEPQRGELLNGSSDKILVEGYPVGGFWSYSFVGLSAEDGRPLFNYLDVPEEEVNGNVDPLTFLVYSGTSEPDFTGGLSFSLRYKNVTLSSGLSLLLGGKKRLPSPYESIINGMYVPEPDVNLSKDLTKRWQRPGDEKRTNIPALVTNGSESIMTLPDGNTESWIALWEQSDEMVVDASFLRCRQLSLTYRLGDEFCKKLKLKTFSVSATVSNLFVIANERFNGFDPELGNSVYPKNYSIGINVGF